ncbi:MAG: hypothetical protein KGI97_01170 [Alphaproteobacteria bacterium]|nr:hypothetical protein [Alphaproteobacteria bacterium]
MLQYVTILGAAIATAGSFSYLRDTFKGRTKPNRVTYAIWAATALTSTAAGLMEGVRWAVLPVFLAGLLPALIFVVSFHNKNAYWRTRGFDYVCGFLSAMALVLWRITHDANIAIGFSIVSNLLAAVPTMLKAWTHPESESAATYATGAVSAVTAFVAAPAPSFAAYAFPACILLDCLIILFALWHRKIARLIGLR